ncbi:MAG: hypothetical protein ACREF4_06000 [Gammaproteobacteria bacterium]
MKFMTRALACTLVVVIGLAASAASGQDVYTGTVTRIDQAGHVIIFEDGRMYRMVPSSVVLVDNQPIMYTTLQPGARVVIRGGEPVLFRDGQYVMMSTPARAPATTTVTTVTTTPSPFVSSATGVVASYDPRTNIVRLTDGRMVLLSSKTAILVNGHPTTPAALYPGMAVVLSAVNPVVSRDGRSVILNEGFFDAGNGGAMTWDSKYAGYEADTDNAAMQVQSGG